MLGPEDFALSAGMQPIVEGLIFPSQMVVFAARAAGVTPYGCIATVASYKDVDFVRDVMRRSHLLGFEGASCIHPSVVRVINEAFTPSTADYQRSRRIVEVFEAGLIEGKGAVELDGEMIDSPVVERARRTIDQYQRPGSQG